MSLKTYYRRAGQSVFTLLIFSLFYSNALAIDKSHHGMYNGGSHNRVEQRTFANRHGSIIAKAYTLPDGRIYYHNRSGRSSGYSLKESPNSRMYSNSAGSYQFRETYMKSGNSTFYGRNGSPRGYSRKK